MMNVQDGSGELKTQVELGAEVYCQARVPDTSRVFIGIGLGFHLECTLDEVSGLVLTAVTSRRACWDACTS